MRQIAREIYLSAEAYYKSYLLCLNERKERIEIDKDLFALPLTQAAIVNHAFACELYLKAIYYLENGKFKEGHIPNNLFNALSPGAKSKITELFNLYNKDAKIDLIISLESFPQAYTRLRYWFSPWPIEYRGKGVSYLLHPVMLAIRNYILEIEPEWPILVEVSKDDLMN